MAFSSSEWAHAEIEFVIADGPTPGSWTGAAGMTEAWRGFLSAWEEFRTGADEYRELDHERVLVPARFSGRGKTSGLEAGQIRTEGATLFHVRCGKVTRLVVYYDRERGILDASMSDQTVTSRPPVTLREPARGSRWGSEVLELSGVDRMRAAVDRKLPDSPFMRLTGLRPTEVGFGFSTWAMPASPWWQSDTGVFLPGTLAFVADSALGSAVMTSVPPAMAMPTAQLAIEFLRTPTVRSQSIAARGRLIHAAGSLALSEVFVEDAKGRALAHGTSRCVLVPLDSDARKQQSEPTTAEPKSTTPDPYARALEGALEEVVSNEASGFERLREIERRVHASPVMELTGLRVLDIAEGEVTVGMAASPWLTTWYGVIYGGAVALLAEGASTAAVLSTLPPATACAPLDLKVNFLRPVLPHDGEVTAHARVSHKGRTIAIVHAEVRAEGKLAAIANETVLILPGRGWDKPIDVADEVVPLTD
jgi:uncharacterized protein (TIGR00369 family)